MVPAVATSPPSTGSPACWGKPAARRPFFRLIRVPPASCSRVAADLGAARMFTITGSDMFDEAQRCRPETVNALRRAAAVVCFDELVAAETITYFPELAGRLRIIPQGVEQLAPAGPALSELAEDVFVVLFPAALRPVKNLE